MAGQPPSPADRRIGKRIREAREHSGLTAQVLARFLKMTKQGVLRYEDGSVAVRASTLAAIAKVLSKPIGFFYGEGR